MAFCQDMDASVIWCFDAEDKGILMFCLLVAKIWMLQLHGDLMLKTREF